MPIKFAIHHARPQELKGYGEADHSCCFDGSSQDRLAVIPVFWRAATRVPSSLAGCLNQTRDVALFRTFLLDAPNLAIPRAISRKYFKYHMLSLPHHYTPQATRILLDPWSREVIFTSFLLQTEALPPRSFPLLQYFRTDRAQSYQFLAKVC